MAIVATDEYIVRAGTHTVQIITLATSASKRTVHDRALTDIKCRIALPVVWRFDVRDVEEIEHFPLCKYVSLGAILREWVH